MDINTCFPSNYLKASDLQGKAVTVTMRECGQETIGEDNRLVLYFQDKDKGLVLNKTNANTIAAMFGPETDGWIGKAIQVFPTTTDFQGRRVACIRVQAAHGKAAPATVPPEPTYDPAADDPNNEIPF